eukprot:TRINITY_DN17382_c0_g1_i1.p1 TRINITY_DN17382_c0_g1~~TRINITY_DN17382_c0_g1_i1.p1  ORF type:complete len:211 (+),score=56.49 TRINITY_DN17382_c0_g1_i1:36-635(+)
MPAEGNMVEVLSTMLTQFTSRNDQLKPASRNSGVSVFESYQAPGISIKKYFARLDKYFHTSEEIYVISVILIDRLISKHPLLYLTSFNVHRLLATAVVVTAKMRDDCYYSNKYYSGVAGIRLSELNYLELHFLLLLDFELHVGLDEFCKYIHQISMQYGPIVGPSEKYVLMAEKFIEEGTDDDMETEEEAGEEAARRLA